jgi:membrane protein DedA with SNARE-associated domain
MFFTSIFTTALSIASFSAIAHTQNIFITASIGAIGAVIGDLFLFTIFRKTLRKDVDHITSVPKYDKYFSIFRRRMFRWIIPLVGALIIASPLPDELGIAMMGLSSMRVALLIPISFTMNFLGILLIGAAALAF